MFSARNQLSSLCVLASIPGAPFPARAQTDRPGQAPGAQVTLELGPIRSGEPLLMDLRTTVPGGTGWLLLGLQAQPFPSQLPGLPALAIAPQSVVPVPLDVDGRARLVLPTHPAQFLAGQGLVLHLQAGALDQASAWRLTPLVSGRIEASPQTSFLVDESASWLPTQAQGLGAVLIEAADVDGDGRPDLVLAGSAGLGLWRGGPSGFSVQPAAFPPHSAAIGSLTLGDVDADGDLDLFVGAGSDLSLVLANRLFRNHGGQFTLDTLSDLSTGVVSDSAFIDADLDGDLDLCLVRGGDPHLGSVGEKDLLYLNDGTGKYTQDPGFDGAWNTTLVPSTCLATGDIDGDGDSDLCIGRADWSAASGVYGARNVLLENSGTGSGVFMDVSSKIIQQFADNTADLAFVDIDLDGDLDLMAANSFISVPAASSNDLLINLGGIQGGLEGFFLDSQEPALENGVGSLLRLGIHPADVDSDGDMDLLVGVHELGSTPSYQPLLMNQGGSQPGPLGSLGFQPWFDPGDFISSDVQWIDVDLDGDLDLIQGAAGSLLGDPKGRDLRFFRNTIR